MTVPFGLIQGKAAKYAAYAFHGFLPYQTILSNNLLYMTENKSRHPRRSSDELRDDVLNAATEIIGEDGFAKSSLMRIANLANVESTVFHRHFGNWEEFMDCFTRKYDYWFSDVVDSVEKNQCVEKEFSSTLHRLFDELNEDVIMQKLLKWEIHDANVITKRTARMREFNTMPLIRHYQRALGETDIRIGAVLALLMGGIYFLVLHKDCSPLAGIDVNDESGRQEIHNAIDWFSKMLFSRPNEQDMKRNIADILRSNGVSEDIIEDCCSLL